MKKALKIIGIVLLALLILLFGAQLWLGNKIKRTIEEKGSEQTQGNLHIDVGRVNVRLIGRTVRIKDIQITTDSSRASVSGHSSLYTDAYIREIAVKGIHFRKEDSITRIRAREFILDIPRAEIRNNDSVSDTTRTTSSNKQLSVDLQIEKTDFRLGDIRYVQYHGRDTVVYSLKDFRCTTEDLKAEPDSPDHPYACSEMKVSFSSFQNIFAQKSQLLKIDSFFVDSKEEILSVEKVGLIPLYSENEFAIKAPGHIDWTRVETGKIVCNGFDLQSVLQNRLLKIDSVHLYKADIRSFKNRQIEQPQRVKRLFYESVQQFPYRLAIRRVGLEHIQVEYQELAKNGISPGTVTFSELHGVFHDLTNIVTPKQPYFTLKAAGKLMGQGLLQATFRLPVDSLNPHFEVEGSLGRMNLEALNKMTEPLVKIRIMSGEVNEMNFKITGNSQDAQVHMLFLYDDLKVRILKEKDGEWKTRSFLTNIVNGLILDKSNPNHRGTREADGKAERDIYRSQFNYLWRTLLAGLKISVGL